MTISRRALLDGFRRSALGAAASEVVPGAVRGASADTVHMFVVWGQSCARGANRNRYDQPVSLFPRYPHYALIFDQGVIPDGRPVSRFAPLHEHNYGATHETICSQAAFAVERRTFAEAGAYIDILMTVSAESGRPYVDIGVGTPVYAEILRLVTAGKQIAAAKGKSLVVEAILALHGESDYEISTPEMQYLDDLIALRLAATTDIAAITGQAGPVRLLTYQILHGHVTPGINPQIPIAQLAVMDADPLCTCVGPMYFVPAALGDSKHPLAIGYAQLGELFGTAVLGAVFGSGFAPCRTTGVSWVSTGRAPTLVVTYNRPVAIDVSNVIVNTAGLTPGMGFDFADGSPHPPAITSVAMAAGADDTVEITLSGLPSGNAPQLFYACRSTGPRGYGNQNGARGLIREARPYMRSVTGVMLYHWACVEVLALPPA